LPRIIAVARETNEASRQVMEDIGMRPAGSFNHKGHAMVVYESVKAG
jgi:RimJ/RimL family protein N-acetyltransferase